MHDSDSHDASVGSYDARRITELATVHLVAAAPAWPPASHDEHEAVSHVRTLVLAATSHSREVASGKYTAVEVVDDYLPRYVAGGSRLLWLAAGAAFTTLPRIDYGADLHWALDLLASQKPGPRLARSTISLHAQLEAILTALGLISSVFEPKSARSGAAADVTDTVWGRLIDHARSPDSVMSSAAVRALAIALLLQRREDRYQQLLDHPDRDLARSTVLALGKLGMTHPLPDELIDRIAALTTHPETAWGAILAIGRIGAVHPLPGRLLDQRLALTAHPNLAQPALLAISEVGTAHPPPPELIDRIAALTTHPETAWGAIFAIGRIGAAHPLPYELLDRLLDRLIALTTDRIPGLEPPAHILKTVGRIGAAQPLPRELLKQLVDRLMAMTTDPNLAEPALEAIGAIGATHPPPDGLLNQLLDLTTDPNLAGIALRTIGRVGATRPPPVRLFEQTARPQSVTLLAGLWNRVRGFNRLI